MPQLAEMARSTEARLLSFAYAPAPTPVRVALGLPEGARAQVAVRVRLAAGEPFSHLTTHVPEDIARGYSEADLAAAPLLELLERSGVRIEAAHQSVSATLASPDVAQALEVAEGSALLFAAPGGPGLVGDAGWSICRRSIARTAFPPRHAAGARGRGRGPALGGDGSKPRPRRHRMSRAAGMA
jgi:hypothetical protein